MLIISGFQDINRPSGTLSRNMIFSEYALRCEHYPFQTYLKLMLNTGKT
jgi:hypothetical protein